VTLLLVLTVAAGCGPRGEAAHEHSGYGYLANDYPRELQAGEHALSRSQIARGDSLYQRTTGNANCVLCHGPFLAGSSEGTNLRDRRWHHGDGSYPFLVRVITHGTQDAPLSPIPPMPPLGGVRLTQRDVEALAAYVYWFTTSREPWEFEPRRPDDLEEYPDPPVVVEPVVVTEGEEADRDDDEGEGENGSAEGEDEGDAGGGDGDEP
jgi:mono/diheme cytochrome c family protein